MVTKKCAICGREFFPVRSTQIYCGRDCYKKSQSQLQKKYRTSNEDWQPIPSLNYRYEINQFGEVRNSITKRLCKAMKHGTVKRYFLSTDQGHTSRSVQQLLWEVHGVLPKNPAKPPVAVTIKKSGAEVYYFPNIVAAAKFLSPIVYYAWRTIKKYMIDRVPAIADWKITYHKGV